ncbi:hypothetical protein [Acidipropionibacterium jensenii]|uniref:hypothetical protein n=1 Tax=Acidipropionibacterium jensenii TaxID=1749 RepID=UPI002649485B|nr:hypothetical protein [Acidipropionibacterium jensenii]MDN5977156.1 hypothetical protein [Acidipropionibacterium jensenii]MDN6441840.1 hypothetical protein [Acidipropionibacterium jensenii]MDN6658529.1 hypothetical protein [Acidipropionibacterium jensenii]MDN6791905.1 hypothetical protein [Acidipropionibacterium jensenii]MDN6811540.1 hypothetical protein [Acidipropionibacterium jensenii]
MPRRVSLPGADELFRPTTPVRTPRHRSADRPHDQDPEPIGEQDPDDSAHRSAGSSATARRAAAQPGGTAQPAGSAQSADSARRAGRSRSVTGRVRHDEKITVYVSTGELIALETARVALKAHGISADRGRIVREAIAIALADLDTSAESSALVARLSR